MNKIAGAQRYFDGLKTAEMGLDFSREFFGVYPKEVFGHMLAVGPMQAYIGLAIKNGHLTSATEVAELREQLATARERIKDMLKGDDAQAWDEARKFVSRLKS